MKTPKESKIPVGQEFPRAHIEVLKGRQRRYNPFGILKWTRGDSRPTGSGSLSRLKVAAPCGIEFPRNNPNAIMIDLGRILAL